MLIKELPSSERPRERLRDLSASALSNTELIAIIIKTGTKNYSSKYIAEEVLSKFEGVNNLADISINKLKSINGIGSAKAIELIAAIELGKRVYSNADETINLNTPLRIYEYFNNLLKGKKQEFFYTIYLDAKGNFISKKLLFIGTVNASMVHPREVFKEAYINSAVSIICIHNHPSGDINPSKEDISVTKKLVSIGKIHNIKVLDHVIIGKGKYYSFFENNRI